MENNAKPQALIMGGSCELAMGLAQAMVQKDIYPILTYRSDQGKMRIEAFLQDVTENYTCFPLDLSQSETFVNLDHALCQQIDYFVDFAHGELEGLVASADSSVVAAYLNANIANRSQVLQRVSRAMLAQRKGRMVYVSSVAASRPNAGQGFYAAAKQACEALYRNIGLELACRGVTTITLRPGYVNTGRGHRYIEQQQTAPAMAKVPLGRALVIDEVVDTIMFLICDSAVGFNATVLTMDGGLSGGKQL